MGMTLETDTVVPLTIGTTTYNGRLWQFEPLLPWTGDTSTEADTYRTRNAGKTFQCHFFGGIRYATAARWKPPVLYDPGAVTLDASRFVAVCHQGSAFEGNDIGREPTGLDDGVYDFPDYPVREGEDCQRLHIWRPTGTPPAGGWPTLVFFHGGGNDVNSPASYQLWGHWLAAMGIQMISVGYRLGLFGYMYHPAWEAEGDWEGPQFAHMDRRAGLEWINTHAADLEVDTSKVCIYGGSAGGVAVLLMLADSAADSWYTRAVSCSGGGFYRDINESDNWRGDGYAKIAGRIERALQSMGSFRAPGGRTYAQIAAAGDWGDALRAMPPDMVVKLQEDGFDGINQFPWLDETAFPHGNSYRRAEAGLFNNVPIMLWYTGNEASVLGVQDIGDAVPGNPSINAEIVGQNYAQMIRSAPWDAWDENERQRMLVTYRTYGGPAYAIAHTLADQGYTVLLNLWNYVSDGLNADGAGHIANIPYALGNQQWQISLTGEFVVKMDEVDLRAWWKSAVQLVNFVAEGNPNTSYSGLVDLGLWETPLTPWTFTAFNTTDRTLNAVGTQARWGTNADVIFNWDAGWSAIFEPFRTGAK
jgi:carboxylesterase type B